MDGASAILRETMGQEARALGFSAHGFLDRLALLPFVERYPEASRRYSLDRSSQVLCVALAFGDGLPPAAPRIARGASPSDTTLARIGRFARANWYAEVVDRLGLIAAAARRALDARGFFSGRAADWHRLANSGLPERPLAIAAGLGRPGRSGLLLVPGAGPGVVLGLLLVPAGVGEADTTGDRDPVLPVADGDRFIRGVVCGSCRACVDACPSGALDFDGSYDRERCLQHWTSREGALPPDVEAVWGDRLYGCDECTVSCPRFSSVPAIEPRRGILGEGLPAGEIETATDEELRARLRGSALGMRWIAPAALRRNARLARTLAASSDISRLPI